MHGLVLGLLALYFVEGEQTESVRMLAFLTLKAVIEC